MSRDKIDKAIYDKERYESLRESGVSEDRAKRVGTVPKDRAPKASHRDTASPGAANPGTTAPGRGEGLERQRREFADRSKIEGDGPQVRTTSKRTGI